MEERRQQPPDAAAAEEEPRLKYRRLGNDLADAVLARGDSISCVVAHAKFVCVGTRWGRVHVLDHEGNVARTLPHAGGGGGGHGHSIAVDDISIDEAGAHVATCSRDGRVRVRGLYGAERDHSVAAGAPVGAVAIDPDYDRAGAASCRFVVGDCRLALYERTFFNRLKCTTLQESEGTVRAVAWRDRFVAWCGDVGVRVYDVTARCSLGLIRWESDPATAMPPTSPRCCLAWSSDLRTGALTLYVGRADTVRVCAVRRRDAADARRAHAPEHCVDPRHTFRTDRLVCGLAPFDDRLVVLGHPKDNSDDATDEGRRPALVVLDYADGDAYEACSDSLNVRGHEQHHQDDYRLACVPGENRFFVASPQDVIVASEYDVDDRVRWYLARDMYDRAKVVLEEAGGRTEAYTTSSIELLHAERALERGEYEEASRAYANACASDPSLWESEIYKFSGANALRFVCDRLPTAPERRLSPQIYELVLCELIKFDPRKFLAVVKRWDPSLYKINAIVGAVIERLLAIDSDDDKSAFLESLGVLYCHQKKYDKSLSMYLKLRHKDAFVLIRKHNLYDFIHDKILALMKLDCDEAIATLIRPSEKSRIEAVPYEAVEAQLATNNFYLYKYLDALGKVEGDGRHHGKLVGLYAEFAREKLLPFLKCSDKYPITEALNVCKERNYHPETVYLLGKIGSTREALDIIIKKLGDIDKAISFCQEHDDAELWTDLVDHSLDSPQFITLLLKRIGNYVDPRILIEGIRPGCEIEDLKDSLGKMMRDYNLQLSVQDACKAITFRNYFDLHERLVAGQNRGVRISDEYLCSGCHRKVIIKDASHAADVVVYNCRHVFHMECLKRHEICAICYPVKSE